MKIKFNVPNKITILRVALIPLFVIILLTDIPIKNILSAIIFTLLSLSDFLDGYFARKKRQSTELGKLVDPIADKLLISTALIFLIGKGVDLWIAVTIISREVILTAIRIYLAPTKVVAASKYGKVKTFMQSIAIISVLLGFPFSWHLMLIAVLITVVTGIIYLIKIKQATGNRIVNLPNIITLSRFLLIIPFSYFFLNSKILITLIIFAVITLSDKLDGIFARLMNQKTELGSGFDSFTDWTLIITTFILFVIKEEVSILWLIVVSLPAIISGILKIKYAKKKKTLPVIPIARLSVCFIYITITSILIKFADNAYTFYLLTITSALVYFVMISYIVKVVNLPNLSKK